MGLADKRFPCREQDLASTLRAAGAAEEMELLEAERDRLAALADDTIAELEAMKSENIHLSSGAVMHEEERQSFKGALAKLTGLIQASARDLGAENLGA